MACIKRGWSWHGTCWSVLPVWAKCVATRDEEQAVSVEMQGPWSPKEYDTRPTMKGKVLPVLAAADVVDMP